MAFLRDFRDFVNIRILRFLCNEKGQTLVEYGLLVVLIAIVVILMLRGTGRQVNCLYSTINSGLTP